MNKFLTKLNLLDSSGSLSITNLMVYIAGFSAVFASGSSLISLGVFAAALINYGYKRYVEYSRSVTINTSNQEVIETVKRLETRLKEQDTQIASYSKVVEEAKSVITASKISSANNNNPLIRKQL